VYLPPFFFFVLNALCVGVFKLFETLFIYLFFSYVVLKGSKRQRILQGNFVCVHLPPLLYL
jgi:hypothetical protein